ncbi:MAG: transposase [Deltaproteobacteria bacterium]|nr:transposase [Candidatus Anaeroferrophillacea bacterium]
MNGHRTRHSADFKAKAQRDLHNWFNWYNERWKHSSLDKMTPNEAYEQGQEVLNPAA